MLKNTPQVGYPPAKRLQLPGRIHWKVNITKKHIQKTVFANNILSFLVFQHASTKEASNNSFVCSCSHNNIQSLKEES
jgi:hypothetical protein